MKGKICKAFCDDLRVRDVPAGLAITTTFTDPDGDHIGFYVIKDGEFTYRIEDDGVTLPYLECSGVDFRSGTRGEALNELFAEYKVQIHESTKVFFIERVAEADLPASSLKFVAFSLRIRDFMLMTEFRIATTFREDAAKLLREVIKDRVTFERNSPILPRLSDFPADFVLRSNDRPPVGVYLGMSDQRILEALFMHMRARHEVHEPCSIVALIERGSSLSARVKQQAMNRLDAVTEFRGDEVAAVERIAYEAIGTARH